MATLYEMCRIKAPSRGHVMATVNGSLDLIRGARFNGWGWGKISEALGLPRSSGTAVRTAYIRTIQKSPLSAERRDAVQPKVVATTDVSLSIHKPEKI